LRRNPKLLIGRIYADAVKFLIPEAEIICCTEPKDHSISMIKLSRSDY